MKLATGTKRTSVSADSARAVDPSLTVPMANQFVPELLEYCQTPWVAALAALATMA